MKHAYKKICVAAACGAGVLASAGASAQSYPTHAIELTVPYGAGGATDVIARRIAALFEQELGQTIVVVNKPGGAGTLQAAHLARSKPDGYTIGLMGYTSLTYTVQLMSKQPYTLDDFTILGGIGNYTYGMVVPADSPIQNIADLIAASKRPQGVSYGVTGAPNNIALVKLGQMTGGKFEQINYKSGAEAVMAASGKHVDLALQNPQDFVPLVKSGVLRMIASATENRVAGLENVPTIQEQGYDVVVTSALGLAAPKGIPEEVRQRLEQALAKVLQKSEYADFMKEQHMIIVPMDGAGFRKVLEDGYRTMGQLIKDLNVPMIN